MVTEPAWRVSSRSANNANCVELCTTLDRVRDSKNAAGPVLRVDVPALLHAIQAGHLDR